MTTRRPQERGERGSTNSPPLLLRDRQARAARSDEKDRLETLLETGPADLKAAMKIVRKARDVLEKKQADLDRAADMCAHEIRYAKKLRKQRVARLQTLDKAMSASTMDESDCWSSDDSSSVGSGGAYA